MKRREFLHQGLVAGSAFAAATRAASGATRKHAYDTVYLGPDKVKLSRLAMGTGTSGFGGASNQTRQLGTGGVADLFWFGYDNGVTFWDSADQYGSHPHLKEALENVPRDKVTILTKTHARTAGQMHKDLDRYRREIGTDYIDIVLLHAMRDGNWPEQRKGAMEVLSEAREKGVIGTHGTSCHTLAALKTAAADSLGTRRSGAYQRAWRKDGFRPGNGHQRPQADEARRQGRDRHEDPRGRRDASSRQRGAGSCAGVRLRGLFHGRC